MKYTKFYIKNYKGIDNVIIDLKDHRIVTLVGLNESGKTTIMEAIAPFYRLSKGENISTHEINSFRPKGIAFTGKIVMKATLEIEPEDEQVIQKHWAKEGKIKKLKFPKEFSYEFTYNFNLHSYVNQQQLWTIDLYTTTAKSRLSESDNSGWNMIVSYIKKNVIPEILYYDDFIFEIPEPIKANGIQFNGDEKDEDGQPLSKAYIDKMKLHEQWTQALNDVLRTVQPQLDFREHVIRKWADDEEAARQRLSRMEGELNKKITARWRELFGKDKTHFKEIRIIPKYFKGNTEEGIESRLELSFKVISEDSTEFLVSERSKGFKWFFSYLLFTEFRKKRTKNILFLLDEPASNLHSSAQAKILDAINNLSADSMVIYSTHSHHLIKPDWLGGTYICINEKITEDVLKGDLNIIEGSKITAKKYFNYVGLGLGSDKISYIQPILDPLDYKPSLVEPIPNITITEGKYDWYAFKYFSEIILKDEYEYNFYPGPGKDKLWEIIRLYLAWGKGFIVVFDSDIAGINAKGDYEKEFQEYIKGKIFSLEDIFKRKTDMEGLIEIQDQELIHDTIYGLRSFNKIKTNAKKLKENLNYAINQLLLQKKEVFISKETKENFNKLFEFIVHSSKK